MDSPYSPQPKLGALQDRARSRLGLSEQPVEKVFLDIYLKNFYITSTITRQSLGEKLKKVYLINILSCHLVDNALTKPEPRRILKNLMLRLNAAF